MLLVTIFMFENEDKRNVQELIKSSDVFVFKQKKYAMRGITFTDFFRFSKLVNAKWEAHQVPIKIFKEKSQPISYFIPELKTNVMS